MARKQPQGSSRGPVLETRASRIPEQFITCVLLVTAFALVEVPGAFLLIGRGEQPPGVVQFGLWPPAVIAGEWRLLSSALLHAGLYHLLVNTIGHLVLGMLAESPFGTKPLAGIAIGTAVAGSLASLTVRFRLERTSLAWLLGVSVATVLNGLLDPRVNNAAHIGGSYSGEAEQAAQ